MASMKAVISNGDSTPPCVVYWTGRVRLHVDVITWCDQTHEASEGVLQVPGDVEVCKSCEQAIKEKRYPRPRR
jgi:hypothetical protein